MPRPFMQHGVTELEQLFAQSRSDPGVLKQLEHELRYRQVPRAVALLAEVQAAMYGGSPKAPTPPPPTARPAAPRQGQSNLFPTADLPRHLEPSGQTGDRPIEAEPVPTSPPARMMPLEEACKVLKTSPGATWESVEANRRALVQQSSPSLVRALSAEKRAQLRTDATRVNLAYAAILQARRSGR
jgi:hypothetical protein